MEDTYRSGTEWEYWNAREGDAVVWVYHRPEVPNIPLDDPEFEAKREQLLSLNTDFHYDIYGNPFLEFRLYLFDPYF